MTDLVAKSAWLRREILEMVVRAGQGHIPSSFSMVEILVALYYGGVMSPNRDKVIISKGHAAMAVYPILADFGYFPRAELEKFTQPHGILGMYADPRVPGISAIAGSLGHGLGMACGMAMADPDRHRRVFVILGDGECQEGSVWEAAQFATYRGLPITVIVDRNCMSILGEPEVGTLYNKFAAFGWPMERVDGHSTAMLVNALREDPRRVRRSPLCVIADTVKGKGLSFMEGKAEWHSRVPKGAELETARGELS